MQYHFKEYRTVQKIETRPRKDNGSNGWNSFSSAPRKIADIRGIAANKRDARMGNTSLHF